MSHPLREVLFSDSFESAFAFVLCVCRAFIALKSLSVIVWNAVSKQPPDSEDQRCHIFINVLGFQLPFFFYCQTTTAKTR